LALFAVIRCWSLRGFCLGLGLEAADLALDLCHAFLRYENLAVDPIEFPQQFFSASIQAFHGGAS
jgi:hypothetical protein